jgi:hypothetical protein
MKGERGLEHLSAQAPEERMQGGPAPAPKEPMQSKFASCAGVRASASTSARGALQGVRGREHLPAPVPKERMQGVRGGEHLPAPAHQETLQGVWWGCLLRAWSPRWSAVVRELSDCPTFACACCEALAASRIRFVDAV